MIVLSGIFEELLLAAFAGQSVQKAEPAPLSSSLQV
jgi:hypothetical protein